MRDFLGLTPLASFEGPRWIVRLQEMARGAREQARRTVGSVWHLRDQLKRGLDILIDGF